jgi:hypothetical protein
LEVTFMLNTFQSNRYHCFSAMICPPARVITARSPHSHSLGASNIVVLNWGNAIA